jgi:hypothetical protein
MLLALLMLATGKRTVNAESSVTNMNDAKMGRSEALRRAMLTFLNDGPGKTDAYPAFWGAFQIVGESAAP